MMFFLYNVIFLALLIVGLVQCKKHSFQAGFYFFLILIVHQIAPYIYSPFVHKYLNSLNSSNAPFGMSMGEVVAWFSLIPRIVETIAFGFLVVGLYQMWKLSSGKS